ncbi:MAG: histidine kinase [Sphingomonas sp. 28-66-16]|nr:MAG: histidine kinase [Sphingomonas sp. 28-66-16]
MSDTESTGGNHPIVGIGASAGGLGALTKLVIALPSDAGMVYLLVQHLDPAHKSLMAGLLAEHTHMPVAEAIDGTIVQPDHLYVIPAGKYLSIANGALRLTKPTEPHGSRLPIDFLFESIAADAGSRSVAVVLSGTGSDGSAGLAAVRAAGGYVLAQEPAEAEFDGMPQAAIATGLVDAVLEVAAMPAAMLAHVGLVGAGHSADDGTPEADRSLADIINLLRERTSHDFTLYKPGTLRRRIEHRMAMAATPVEGMANYLTALKADPAELNLLANDLLINVTSFFRDAKVFDLLATKIIPDIVRDHPEDQALRLWVPGCSTGEEVYSLAILFQEAIAAAKRTIKLCVFASDLDADAVAVAREGQYPAAIAKNVSAARLARWFAHDEHGYRVLRDLRDLVVFTVQDVLADPPFSKLDVISCRNLLIYLGTEAQARVIALFHFALKRGGILLLGNAETIGQADGQFEPVAKPERIFRQIGRSRAGALHFPIGGGATMRSPAGANNNRTSVRQPALADLCRRLVAEHYAPAVVLINRAHECLYSTGPTERYLRVAPGYPTYDLLAMATPALRTRLRTAIDSVGRATPHTTLPGGRVRHDGHNLSFTIDIRSLQHDGEELLLIAFIDAPGAKLASASTNRLSDAPQIVELERELDAVRADLRAAIHDLESSGEDHRAVNEEALSVNEEYQTTNEELLTSKEELQSLNEELTALNGQLQETLERQRTTADDLQNVLYSTDVATLFLDIDLKIRFFTPSTRALFSLIPGDIGRPLADLVALAADPELTHDAQAVLKGHASVEREVAASGGHWFLRRIQPYRAHDNAVEGVVITFVDITERKASRRALELAMRDAENANLAKSRFLAAASHDLRQPLQSLALLQGLLVSAVSGERAQSLIARLDQTLGTMSSMLNTMLDINQIEAGVVLPKPVDFVIGDLLARAVAEFADQAEAQHLDLRMARCSRVVHSDPALIKQMLRNLIANALKYTRQGKVLVGCRQCGGVLRVEVWDSGIGIPDAELHAIFDEYHQIGNAARERVRGLGLGLSIVQRLGTLLGHRVSVRSRLGKGSVFAIEITLPDAPAKAPQLVHAPALAITAPVAGQITGHILVVEDDEDVRTLLDELLTSAGHEVSTASNGAEALTMIANAKTKPELLLSDFNLSDGEGGLQLAARIREKLGGIPVIILTGDISTSTLRDVAEQGCVQFNKPVKRGELTDAIHRLLVDGQTDASPASPSADDTRPAIYIVDDDIAVRTALRDVLVADGRRVAIFPDCESFLAVYAPAGQACLLIDAYLPGIDGFELLRRLKQAGHALPAIMITGSSDVPMAVQAMKAGAVDFIEKPVAVGALLASIDHALDLARDSVKFAAWHDDAVAHINGLTPRQSQVMDMVLAGHPSKNIAADLQISQRTVENHRASIMKKTGAKSLPALARLVLAAGPDAKIDPASVA